MGETVRVSEPRLLRYTQKISQISGEFFLFLKEEVMSVFAAIFSSSQKGCLLFLCINSSVKTEITAVQFV